MGSKGTDKIKEAYKVGESGQCREWANLMQVPNPRKKKNKKVSKLEIEPRIKTP